MSRESSAWMIYGAYGYTGRRMAEAAAARGMRPVLAGRDAVRLRAVAAAVGLPDQAFSLTSPGRIAEHLRGLRAVLHCAGPFSATAAPMIEACLRAGVHYLDITGEINVIEAAAARHEQARRAGVAIIPAVGFDVVPSDCLAAQLAQRLPGALGLQLAFSGLGQVSRGTLRTTLEGMPQGGRARIGGRIVRVPLLWKSREIPFRSGRQPAVTIPWGDVAAAWYSTGIPNIEVYMALPPQLARWFPTLRWFEPLLRLPLPARLREAPLRRLLGNRMEPANEPRVSFWGRVFDSEKGSVEATLETPGAYDLTVLTALAATARVLETDVPAGFSTPSQAFGAEFIQTIPGTDFRWEGDAAVPAPASEHEVAS